MKSVTPVGLPTGFTVDKGDNIYVPGGGYMQDTGFGNGGHTARPADDRQPVRHPAAE